jgi:hypothetical protein
MIATSASRVEDQTSSELNRRIRTQGEVNVAYYAAHPEQIDRRLAELDEEWDIERRFQVNSAALSLLGLALALTRSWRWLLLPLAVQAFFLQHGLQGWCPPLSMLRRLGIRTENEIHAERHALKALRGDFAAVTENAESGQLLEVAER